MIYKYDTQLVKDFSAICIIEKNLGQSLMFNN
jgi:hypothetical protein